jgi:hypothetical protein
MSAPKWLPCYLAWGRRTAILLAVAVLLWLLTEDYSAFLGLAMLAPPLCDASCCEDECLIFEDPFTRANETIAANATDSTGNWTNISNDTKWSILSNELRCNNGGDATGSAVRLNQVVPRQFSFRITARYSAGGQSFKLLYAANKSSVDYIIGLSLSQGTGHDGCDEVKFVDASGGSFVDLGVPTLLSGLNIGENFEVLFCYSAEQQLATATISQGSLIQSLHYQGFETPVNTLDSSQIRLHIDASVPGAVYFDDATLKQAKTFDDDESGDYGVADGCPCCNDNLCSVVTDTFDAADCRWVDEDGTWNYSTPGEVSTTSATAQYILHAGFTGLDSQCRYETSVAARVTLGAVGGVSVGVIIDWVDSSNYHIAVLDIANDLMIFAKVTAGGTSVLHQEAIALDVDTDYDLCASIHEDVMYVEFQGETYDEDTTAHGGMFAGLYKAGGSGTRGYFKNFTVNHNVADDECADCIGGAAVDPCSDCDDDTPEYLVATMANAGGDFSVTDCTGLIDCSPLASPQIPAYDCAVLNRSWVLRRYAAADDPDECGCVWRLPDFPIDLYSGSGSCVHIDFDVGDPSDQCCTSPLSFLESFCDEVDGGIENGEITPMPCEAVLVLAEGRYPSGFQYLSCYCRQSQFIGEVAIKKWDVDGTYYARIVAKMFTFTLSYTDHNGVGAPSNDRVWTWSCALEATFEWTQESDEPFDLNCLELSEELSASTANDGSCTRIPDEGCYSSASVFVEAQPEEE